MDMKVYNFERTNVKLKGAVDERTPSSGGITRVKNNL